MRRTISIIPRVLIARVRGASFMALSCQVSPGVSISLSLFAQDRLSLRHSKVLTRLS